MNSFIIDFENVSKTMKNLNILNQSSNDKKNYYIYRFANSENFAM